MNEEEQGKGQTDHTDDTLAGVIPYRNPAALFAYYCAVFSVIPCIALLLGPAAVILGIAGIVYRNKHPNSRGTAHAWVGIILGGLTTLLNYGFIAFGLLGALVGG
jgi:hypothetical protein